MNSQLPLETLANTIKACVMAGDRATDKAEQHYKAAGMYLIEARELNTAETRKWTAYVVGQCMISTSSTDFYIQLANGSTTLAEHREKNRNAVAAHRERNSPLRNGRYFRNRPINSRTAVPQ
jgi:hypothetical protein